MHYGKAWDVPYAAGFLIQFIVSIFLNRFWKATPRWKEIAVASMLPYALIIGAVTLP